MTPFVMAIGLEVGSTPSPRQDRLAAIIESYGSTGAAIARTPQPCAATIAADIDFTVQDPDGYEEGEPRPSAAAIQAIKDILREAEQSGVVLPSAKIGTYYGEVDATWEQDNRMLRLIAYSDGRAPQLYFCTNTGDALARGETIQPANAQVLGEKLAWLKGI